MKTSPPSGRWAPPAASLRGCRWPGRPRRRRTGQPTGDRNHSKITPRSRRGELRKRRTDRPAGGDPQRHRSRQSGGPRSGNRGRHHAGSRRNPRSHDPHVPCRRLGNPCHRPTRQSEAANDSPLADRLRRRGRPDGRGRSHPSRSAARDFERDRLRPNANRNGPAHRVWPRAIRCLSPATACSTTCFRTKSSRPSAAARSITRSARSSKRPRPHGNGRRHGAVEAR